VETTRLWLLWQALLAPFAACFTRPGFRRFTGWVTGLALNDEEYTITQSLIGLGRPQDWKGLESFAEYGAWDQHAVAAALAAPPLPVRRYFTVMSWSRAGKVCRVRSLN
jgi:hypothetical protein